MIITDGTYGERKLKLLGLSRANIDKLTSGQPIRISSETHGEAVTDDEVIIICFGETEEDIVADFQRHGVDLGKLGRLPEGSD
jgi:hypothetical protein